MHVVLGTPMSLRRHMPVVSSALLALAFVLLPAVAPAQIVTFNGIGTVLASNVDYPTAVAVDSQGNMYVTAVNYSQVLKVTPAGVTSVLSTGSLTAPAGSICGTALCYPEALAVDSAGDLYIADTRNSRIVEVTTAGAVSVLNIASVPAGFGCTTNVCSPDGLAVDSAGDLYIADATNGRVVELTAAGAGSVVSTGSLTVPAGSPCGTVLCGPSGLAVDSAGDLYIADNGNSRVVEITAAGVASGLNVGTPGGVALSYPYGVAVDGSGDVYIADFPNERIVEVAVGGASSVVGAVYCSSANYCDPFAVAADSAGDVFIGDGGNERVMEVSPNVNFGNVTVSSAKTANQQTMGYTFVADDTLTAVNVLTQGASGQDYTADPSSTCVAGGTYGPSSTATCTVVADLSPAVPGLRMGAVQLVDANGVQATTYLRAVGQGPLIAFPPGVASLSSTGSPGGAALSDPSGVAVDVAGNMYIADLANNRVVKVTAAGVSSVLSLTGLTGGTTRNGCSSTGLCEPSGLAVDGAGNLVIADVDNNRVVKVTAAGVASVLSLTGLTGGITTSGCSSTGLCEPSGLAVDGAGNVVIADFDNNRVVEVTAAGVAGVLSLTGLSGGITSSGCSSTGLCRPSSVAVDGAGDIYITDRYNGRVVEVTAGVASVLSLNGLTGGTASYGCSSTGLCGPGGVAVDSAGDVYIADQYNGRVVEVSALGVASVLSTVSLAGTTYGETYYGCPSTGLCVPDAVAVDGAGDVYIADSGNNRMAEVSQAQAVPLSFTPSNDGYNSANSPQDASVQNIGNQPLILSSVTTTTTGQIADSFNLNGSATTCSGSTSLNAGDTCDLGIEFEPLASGPLSGSVNITDNNLYSASPAVTSQQIALSGTGIGYAVSIGLQESATTVAYGTGVSVTATLSGSNGIPRGSVSYSVDGVTLGTAPLTAGATTSSAQFTLPGTIDADTHGVLVSYAGDSNYPIISSAGFSLTVTAESTGTQLTAPPAATAGSAVQLVATVQPAPVTATTGMVTFASTNASGTVQLGAAPLEPGGTALLMTSALPVGIDSVTASFSGTQNFAGSTSAPASVLVTAAGTTTTLSAPGSAVAGSSVNLTATVLAGSTPVTRGIVAFASGTIQLGAAQLGAGGTATLATTTLPVGSDNVTASFAGTQNFAGSTSSQSSVLVTAAGTTTTLSAPGSAVAGSSVNLTATVLIGTTPMTRGMVTFASTNTGGTVQLGSAQVGAGGTATLATTTLPVGSDSVTASFMGTQDVAGSTSSSSTVNVSAVIVPSYTITANPGTLSIAQGKTGTTTLTFTPAGGYAGSLTLSCGNLPSYVTCAFTQNGTANSTVTMSGNGQAVAVTLSFTTNVATARLNAIPGPQPGLPQSPSAPIETAIAFWLPGGVAGMAAMRRKRRSAGNARRWLPLCLIGFIAVVLAAGFSGCGGSSSVTPMGSSSITITATPSAAGSGSQASQTLSLTVTITS